MEELKIDKTTPVIAFWRHLRSALNRGGLAVFFLMICAIFFPASMENSAASGPASKVIVLTDSAGLGDKGFNDVCWQGVLKAKKDFCLDAQFLQSREQADYTSNLALAANRADIVVTLGYLYADSLKETAPISQNQVHTHRRRYSG